jgi:outer membrane murein-binding lipoprotein Lpp
VFGEGHNGVVGRSDEKWAVKAEGDLGVSEFLSVTRLGTRGGPPVEIDVGGQRALRIKPTSSDYAANIIGGHPVNDVGSGVEGATIAGGGGYDGPANLPNTVEGFYGTVGGGQNNTASGYAATVPGGQSNTASGSDSFAAGRGAKAFNDGAFVWGDSTFDDFASTGADQFLVRASGGLYFGDDSSPDLSSGFINTSTGAYLSGGGTWTDSSSRAVKENVEPVAGPEILEKVQTLEVSEWNYEDEDSETRHCGPMAEEFHDTFGLGEDNEHIASLDTGGVALAAIQGLADRLDEKDERIEELEDEAETARAEAAAAREENDRLRERLAAVEKTVSGLAPADAGGAATPADD